MTYRELLARLTDLRALAQQAQPGEKSGCMSSFDRASRFDETTGTYVDWDANADGSGCIRTLPDGTIVAFEQEGPGVIWRVWSALPQQGHMRVFIDDEETPAIDMPFIDWFEKQPDDIPPLNLSELSMRLSRGRNSFIPIPFQKRCRVEFAPEWGAYYHFTYTLFDQGTTMPAYAERFTNDGMIALAQVDRLLYDRGEVVRTDDEAAAAQIAPGETAELFAREGAGMIEEMALCSTDADVSRLILRIYWDGSKTPAVEAPLGEFFGGAPGYARYRCLLMSMERARYTCRFAMPYADGCRVEIVNLSDAEQNVSMRFAANADFVPQEDTMRFHAKYTADTSAIFINRALPPAATAGRTGRCCWSRARRAALWACTCTFWTRGRRRKKSPSPGGTARGTRRPWTGGGAKATKSSSWTANCSPPPSAPAARTTSATPGRRSRRSPGLTARTRA